MGDTSGYPPQEKHRQNIKREQFKMTSEKHIGLATMYDNTHGNEFLSILNALSGILDDARSMGAEEADCEGVREEIILGMRFKTYKEIKKHIAEWCFLVPIDGGFFDVGYLLSLRF